MSTNKTEKDSTAKKRVIDPFRDEVERIVLGKHSDPFQILGPHWIERGGQKVLAIRSLRPDATTATR